MNKVAYCKALIAAHRARQDGETDPEVLTYIAEEAVIDSGIVPVDDDGVFDEKIIGEAMTSAWTALRDLDILPA